MDSAVRASTNRSSLISLVLALKYSAVDSPHCSSACSTWVSVFLTRGTVTLTERRFSKAARVCWRSEPTGGQALAPFFRSASSAEREDLRLADDSSSTPEGFVVGLLGSMSQYFLR